MQDTVGSAQKLNGSSFPSTKALLQVPLTPIQMWTPVAQIYRRDQFHNQDQDQAQDHDHHQDQDQDQEQGPIRSPSWIDPMKERVSSSGSYEICPNTLVTYTWDVYMSNFTIARLYQYVVYSLPM